MVPPSASGPLAGGGDHGAHREGAVVRRRAGPWSPAVHALLHHLALKGVVAPRPVRLAGDVEVLTHLEGRTVGNRLPWPAWLHDDAALVDVGRWLRRHHDAVADFVPPPGARWREVHASPGPDVVVAHNDAAPYNAVWDDAGLVGFVDWDMAGPRTRLDDLGWVAFSWVPFHARHVVAEEGFRDVDRRLERLRLLVRAYDPRGDPQEVLARLPALVAGQVRLLRERAISDETYAAMVAAGRDRDLERAGAELREGAG